MSEVSAAMGLTSIESMDEIVRVNRDNHAIYVRSLSGISGIQVIPFGGTEQHNYQYVVTEVGSDDEQLSRDNLQTLLLAENVMTRRYFYPGCHRLQPYVSASPTASEDLPVTEKLINTVLCFPTGTAVDNEAIERISEIVRFVLSNGNEIEHRLQGVVA